MDRIILGKIYVGDNENVLFSINKEGISEIFLMNDECDYKLLVSDRDSINKLNFNEHHQITGIYRLRRGCEKTIYFTDNYNPPRYLNLSDINSFKEIVQTSPLIDYGNLDAKKMLLQKVYGKIPKISAEIGENGLLLSGSYNLSVRYVDEDLNPSEWIYTTEPIMIWQSNEKDFSRVRASSNDDLEYRKYGPTNKSIRVSVMNNDCDHSYMFVQFALIGANGGTGFVNDVMYSPLIELDFTMSNGNYENIELVYNFTGGSDVMTGSEEEILANTEIFDKVKCIEQADNRLIMGNVTDMDVDWCKLQKYASRITADCIEREVDISDYDDDYNHKNPNVLFNRGVGYQPGEIYSFGIVYVFENGAKSPVYHIPGRSSLSMPDVPFTNGAIAMRQDNNECHNAKYSDVSMACDGFKFWGYDCLGNPLDGQPIRHHRFPFKNPGKQYVTENDISTHYIAHYNMIVGVIKGHSIRGRFRNNFDTILVKYNVNTYDSNDVCTNQDEYEMEIDYKSKGFWNSIVKDLDVTLEDFGNSLLVGHYHCTPFNPLSPWINAESIVDEDLDTRPSGFANTSSINPFLHITNRFCSNPNSDCTRSKKNRYLKNHRQHRYLDIFSLDITDDSYALFQNLQEYPQFRENNSDITSRPVLMTTGSVIVYHKYGGIISEEKKTNIASMMESLDDDFFLNAVKALPFSIPSSCDNTFANIKNGRRVRLVMPSLNTGDSDDSEFDLYYFKNNGKYNAFVNTSIGYHIEERVEAVDQIEYNNKNTILGIRFGNIDIPDEKFLNGHKVIGYYIVQNERTDEDVTIIDSAILVPLFQETENGSVPSHKSVTYGQIFTDDKVQSQEINYSDITYDFIHDMFMNGNYYLWPNYITDVVSNLTKRHLFKDGVGIIYPQFKFNKKEYYDFKFRLQGYYYKDNGRTRWSSAYNEMWITQDVQAGSSYNKSINSVKDTDNDGMDLHVYHKNCIVNFNLPFGSDRVGYMDNITFNKDDVHYLVPSSTILKKLNNESKTVFNASGDNTMGFIFNLLHEGSRLTSDELFFTGANHNRIERLPYGYMERELEDYYPNFKDRPYYAVTDFIPFRYNGKEPNANIFNGDCFISPMKYNNSIQYDIRMKKRRKKQTWWQYAIGITGAVAATVGAVYTRGATSAFIGPSLAMLENGIRTDVAFNTMKKFKDIGGNKALTDGWVRQYLDTEQTDDEIQWLCESIDNLFFESRINMNWRIGVTDSDLTDYLSPLSGYDSSELRQYFLKKLTYADKDKQDGRAYRGFALAEIYAINNDFQRRNHQKAFYCIPITHKCCSECENSFPKRLVYSQQSFAEERTDNYKVFLPGNYKDVNGETGDITNISYQGQEAFMVFTEEGLWQLAPERQQNVNQITQVVSFIGTGDFFKGIPQQILKNDTNLSFGTKHLNSFCNTKYGLFWFSEHDNAVYTFEDKIPTNIFSKYGIGKWFERNGRLFTDESFYRQYREEYPFKDNPSSELGTGYVMGWDNKYERILITKRDIDVEFDSECFYDSKEMKRNQAYERAIELINNGKKNVCYHWSKEKCCYIIDYDDYQIESMPIEYEVLDTDVFINPKNSIIYIDPRIDYYIDDKMLQKCNIEELIANGLQNKFDGNVLFATSQEIYDMIAKYYDILPQFYDVVNNNDVSNIYEFVMKDWSQVLTIDGDNLEYVAFVSNVEGFDKTYSPSVLSVINNLNNSYGNFEMHIYPILQKDYEKFDFYDINDYLTYLGKTFNDIDMSFITDEFIQLTDHFVLGDSKCPDYGSNIDEYRSMLNELKEDILETIESIRNDEFNIGMFDDCVSLIMLVNTYNYFNEIRNSFDFANYDMFNNGTKNLIAFKDSSIPFNAYAIGVLGADWCDVSADYDALATGLQSQTYTIQEPIKDMEDNASMITFVTKIFADTYSRYIENKHVNVYESTPTGNSLDTLKSLYYIFTPNDKSLHLPLKIEALTENDFNELKSIRNDMYIGNVIRNNVSIHPYIYLYDFINNNTLFNFNADNIVMESTSRVSNIPIVSKSGSSVIQNILLRKYTDRREIFNPIVDIEEDIEVLNDNSFTISFCPGQGFISFHSYHPNIYIYTPNNMYSWKHDINDTVISDFVYRHNIRGNYLRFYGIYYPFSIELVDNGSKGMVLGPQLIDSTSLFTRVTSFIDNDFVDDRNTFFHHAYFYNSRQCTLFSDIVTKHSIDDEDYFSNYMTLANDEIAAEKREIYWHLNDFFDYVNDYTSPLHSEDINDRNDFMSDHNMNGWIDKALNESVLDEHKSWHEIEPFRDTYMLQRYFYNPNDECNTRFEIILTTNEKIQSNDNTL